MNRPERLNAQGGTMPADLSSRAQREFGRVNVLCNDAGVYVADARSRRHRGAPPAWLPAVNLFGVSVSSCDYLPYHGIRSRL